MAEPDIKTDALAASKDPRSEEQLLAEMRQLVSEGGRMEQEEQPDTPDAPETEYPVPVATPPPTDSPAPPATAAPVATPETPAPAGTEPPAGTNGEAAPPEIDLAGQIEQMNLLLQEEQIRRQKLEADLDRERLRRDEANSKSGYFSKTLKEILAEQARTQPRRQPDRDPLETSDLPEPQDTAQFDARDQFMEQMAERMKNVEQGFADQAMHEALNGFFATTPDARELQEAMGPHVQRLRRENDDLYQTGNPKLIKKATELVLRSAFHEARAEKLAAARAVATTKRASQMSAITEQKKQAAISGSGSGAPPSPPTTKKIKDMTADEADAALKEWARHRV